MINLRLILTLGVILLSVSSGAQSMFPVFQSEVLLRDNSNGIPSGTLVSSDGVGRSLCRLGDMDGDGVVDIALGAPNDDDGGTDRGAVHIFFMNTDGTVKSVAKISDTQGSFTGTLDNSDLFGGAVTSLGDLDGDGVVDIAVSAQYDDDGGTNRGAVYILFLNSNGSVKSSQKISNGTGGLTATLGDSDYFGRGIARVGDLDGDGNTEIAVTAHGDDDGGTNRGAVYILFLDKTGTVKSEQKISSSSGNAPALDNFDYFGTEACDLGDLDGDFIPDIAISAHGDDDAGSNGGAVYILFMNANGTVKSNSKISDQMNDDGNIVKSNWYFGLGLANGGDIDGDGVTDLLVGAYYAENSHIGYAYMVTLNTDGSVKAKRRFGDGLGWDHERYGGYALYFGLDLLNLGDLNGDGYQDFAIDVSVDAVYILFGDGGAVNPPTAGKVLEASKIAEGFGGYGSTGLDVNDYFGMAASPCGDVDKDGITDLVVGATGDDDGGTDRGAVEILFMNADATVKSKAKISSLTTNFTTYLSNSDGFGRSVAGIGDLNGNGTEDIVVGASTSDVGGTNRGAVYVLFLDTLGGVDSVQEIASGKGGFSGALSNDDRFGQSVANIGDLDDDGVTDIAVGALFDDDGGSDRGAVWILFLNSDGTVKNHQKLSDLDGGVSFAFSNDDWFGNGVAGLGDINNDGVEDIACLVTGYSAGAILVFRMNTDGTVQAENSVTTWDLGGTITGLDGFAASICNIGDINGDGQTDIAVGSHRAEVGKIKAGGFWTIYLDNIGEPVGYQAVNNYDGNLLAPINSPHYFGRSVGCLGDINGDGHLELAVGANGDNDAGINTGAVYVLSLFKKTKVPDQARYAKLHKTLDGSYYRIDDGILHFQYRGEYNTTDLTYNVYDKNNVIVASNTLNTNILTRVSNTIISLDQEENGDNRFRLDMSTQGASLPSGYYVLEVINPKREKFYLRIKKSI